MRKVAIVLVALGASLSALPGLAAPPPPAPAPVRPVPGPVLPVLGPGVTITSVRIPGVPPPGILSNNIPNPLGQGGGPPEWPRVYVDGELPYDIELRNHRDEAVSSNLQIKALVGATWQDLPKVPFQLGPKQKGTVRIVAPNGLLGGSCAPTFHRVAVEGGPWRQIRTTPTCKFKTATVDPTAPVPPDTKAAQRKGRLFYFSPNLVAAPVCGVPMMLSASVKNQSSSNAEGARLTVVGPEQRENKGPAFNLAAGATTPSPVDALGLFVGEQGNYTLRVDANVPTYQTGWYVKVTRECGVSAALE